jgi:hypothetical protein
MVRWGSIAEEMEQYERDRRFLEAHLPEWIERYPDYWVAVFQEELVGVSESVTQLLQILDEKGIPRARATLKFLTTKSKPMLLAGA